MKRTPQAQIREQRAGAFIASCWTVGTPGHQIAAAEAALTAMPAAPGLLRFSIFRGIDDLTLFMLSQWTDEAARDAYVTVSGTPRAATDDAVPNISRDWRDPASLYRSFISDGSAEMRCLVVVRQPLKRPDLQAQRDWADTVIGALESDTEPMSGLSAASFFLPADGGHVLNLAEWTSADAHRAAMKGGNVGSPPKWEAARSHPGITAKPDVRRYQFFGAVEPGSRVESPEDTVGEFSGGGLTGVWVDRIDSNEMGRGGVDVTAARVGRSGSRRDGA
jgi:hypothetical protein